MTFAHPWWLAAGVAFAAIFAVLAGSARRAAAADALAYSNVAFFADATRHRVDPFMILMSVVALGLTTLGIALAGPHVVASVAVRGAVVLCVDTSGSMRSADVAPTRADAAAAAVRAFIDGAPAGTRIAIVAFAGGAGLVQPLTDDKDALRDAIARIPPPNGGTAIGDALAVAARVLPPAGKRAIVLITDGVNNLGADPLTIAPQVGSAGVEIDTIGIGTNGSGQLIPGTAEEAAMDEDALRQIAAEGKGAYARATDAGSLREHLAALANSTTRERKRIDASLPTAIAGGLLLAGALGAGLIAGKFP